MSQIKEAGEGLNTHELKGEPDPLNLDHAQPAYARRVLLRLRRQTRLNARRPVMNQRTEPSGGTKGEKSET